MTNDRFQQQDELEAWLGPAVADLDDEQIQQIQSEADRIDERYDEPDEMEERDAALSAAVQYILGEIDLEQAGMALLRARVAESKAYAAAVQVGVMAVEAGMPEAEVARKLGVDRMTVRKWLGKR